MTTKAETTAAGEERETGVDPLIRGLPLLLGVRELSFNLSLGKRTIERLIATGEFPAPSVVMAGKRLWHRESVRGWIEAETAAKG